MKIIDPSAVIIEDELSQLSIYQRIAYVAGVCYQREPRKTEEEAKAFCRRMVEIGHHSTLEMAVVHLLVQDPSCDNIEYWCPKYLQVTPNMINDTFLVSGSIRAFKELLGEDPAWYGDTLESIYLFLSDTFPTLFPKNSINPDSVYSKTRYAQPNEIPWQHQHVAVRFIVNRAVSHELVRHRVASYLQECLSGDTEVRAYSGKKSWTMERLYEIFTDPLCGIAREKIRIRTKNKDGEIVKAKIKAVFKSGVKVLYKLRTKNGYEIKTSENHIFFTETGERRLKDIAIGDRVFLNGIDVSSEWVREEYIIKNRKRADIAKELGMSDAWLGKKIAAWGLTKPKKNYPGRKPGRGIRGMHSEEEKRRISNRMVGQNNHRWVGDNVSVRGGRSRLHRVDSAIGKTCVCGKPAREIHHIDKNPKNNDTSNLEYVCSKCHRARHYAIGVKIAWLDEVVSIKPCGVGMTYDLEVDRPEHNFAANGFFVHNSQRYCRYEDEVVFILPEWFRQGYRQAELDWGSHMSSCENRYREFLKSGLKPQQARAVLPNSTKTELIAYASLPQWKHMFNLRCSPAADPEMIRVMRPLEQEFKTKYPEAFSA